MKQEFVQRMALQGMRIILISRTCKRCMIIVVLCMIGLLAYFSAQWHFGDICDTSR